MAPSGVVTLLRKGLAGLVLVGSLAAGPGLLAQPASQPVSAAAIPAQPEAPSGFQLREAARASRHMVAAAHPLAVQAGLRMLRAGGSALDAAVAAQMVLGLVEPQSSGLGGGAFLLHAEGSKVTAYDGRETAPVDAPANLLRRADGSPMSLTEAAVGGRAVGVPGVLRMLELAHRRHGVLPWSRLFEPAIELAEQGFAVSPRLHAQLQAEAHPERLLGQAAAAAYYYQADGQPWPVGHRLRNPALAAILRQVAERGSVAFHEGPVAADMVQRVRAHPRNPGHLSEADLRGYQALAREALCTDWRVWRICGFPPPSSGHLAIMQILGIGDRLGWGDPQRWGPGHDEGLHHYLEASRLAYADRARYVADPGFVPAPGGDWRSLLDPAYLAGRAALVGPRSMGTAAPGVPPGAERLAWASQPEQPEAGTSHLSVVDAQGRSVSMTTTIEAVFGARLLADGGTGLPGGYLLNNQLTDFSALPVDPQGRPVANRVEPGKRPRSSMSPTLVFERDSGRLVMSVGSPGGAAIIHFVARTLLATLGFGADLPRVLESPHVANFNGPTVLERGRFDPALVQALRARGHEVVEAELTSGTHAILRTPQGWLGAADPRREGEARGD